MNIRQATKKDLPELFRISVAAHRHGYDAFISAERMHDFIDRYSITAHNQMLFVEMMSARLSNPLWTVWLAEEKGTVLGYTVSVVESPDSLILRGLFVHPDAQGQGVGSMLFIKSLEAIDKGTIRLSVIERNRRAISLYERNGFSITGHDPVDFYGAKRVIMQLHKG